MNFCQIQEIKSLRKIHWLKLNPLEKKDFFFSIFRINKTHIFTLDSLSINDCHVKNILQDIKQCK